jgi:hypothetical protein
VRVHLAGEHSREFEALDFLRVAFDLADHVVQGVLILLLGRELVQLGRLAERLVDAAESADDLLERGALAA